MSGSFWQISVNQEFSAAHALRRYHGKCERPHGHNFSVEVRVRGSELNKETEILLDFKTLKTELKAVLDMLDHSDLNETPPFDKINPSSENLSRHIHDQLVPRLAPYPVRIASVTVAEKSGQNATYFPDGE